MDQTLHGVRHSNSYVDDVLIHSPSLRLHINDIREALMRLHRARIQLRADKCRLGYQQIEFVGHLITPSGKACNVCQRQKNKNKTDEPLKPIRAPSKPRQMMAYDVATLPWGNGQFRYFLIMTDLFSKWVEIAPMPDQTSSTILVALNMFWFHLHGLPEAVLSDQGPNVDGAEIRQS